MVCTSGVSERIVELGTAVLRISFSVSSDYYLNINFSYSGMKNFIFFFSF